MITTSDTTKAIAAALLEFQGNVSGVNRDGKNPHFKSRYATLENVLDTARPVLQSVGICVTQAPGAVVDGSLEVTTRLTHATSGEWMQSTMHMPLGKRDPQGAGSATTYGLRYSLMAMLCIPPTDDDGEAAMDRTPPARQPDERIRINAKTGMASSASLKDSGYWEEFQMELLECESGPALTKFALAWSSKAETDKWPAQWREAAKEEINKRREYLLKPAPDEDTFPPDRPNAYADNFRAG